MARMSCVLADMQLRQWLKAGYVVKGLARGIDDCHAIGAIAWVFALSLQRQVARGNTGK